jgi:hypothetical protein
MDREQIIEKFKDDDDARAIMQEIMCKHGLVELRDGVTGWTAATIKENQQEWDDLDQSKDFDFSGYDYWVTNDSGGEPMPASIDDFLKIIFYMD